MSASESLPFIDQHATRVGAAPEATWGALLGMLGASVSAAPAAHFARLLGCSDTLAAGPRPLAAGSRIPGFQVEVATEPQKLALVGRHRFSDYALIFRLDQLGVAGTRLRAETRAEFPGLRGRLYRALVIGSGAPMLITRGLLDAARRHAERA